MENIDPVYFLTPIIVIGFSLGLAIYWRRRHRLTMMVLVFSLVAYFGAIFAKYVLQTITYGPFNAAVSGDPVALGLYFGLQTVFFEVGGAYLVARYAVSRGMMKAKDAEGYGISLAMWENGLLIGGSLLLDYVVYYAILSSGSSAGAQRLFGVLSQSTPSLFNPPASALPLIGYAILERVSSLLVHFSWGYLCVLAVVLRRRTFLMLALPMGLLDFFVPFAGRLGTSSYEGLVFGIGVASVCVAWASTRGDSRQSAPLATARAEQGDLNLQSMFYTNFRRALNFGRIYLVIGMFFPLLLVAEASFAGGAATAAPPILGEIYPLLLPVFVVLGSVGGLMIFSSDKDKGVYEYLIAYGVDPSTIFWGIIIASMGLVTLVLGVSFIVTVGALIATGNSLSVGFGELILFYTLPLSYGATMFMSMAGMIWSQLTTRIAGVNSPVGIAPLLGIAPVLAVLLTALTLFPNDIIYVAAAASVIMIWAVVAMVSIANRKMQRERFLSNVEAREGDEEPGRA